MKADTPITLAAGKYVNRAHALEDWQAIKDAQRFGDFDHMGVAVLSKGSDGVLQVEPLLVNAEKLVVVETGASDLDAVVEKELAKANAGV